MLIKPQVAAQTQAFPPWLQGDAPSHTSPKAGPAPARQSSLDQASLARNGSIGASEGVISFRKKRKYMEEGGDNVHVFEVEPQINTGSPTTHQSVHQAQSSNLNIILSHPEKMAVAHGGSTRQRHSPPSAVVPTRAHQSTSAAEYYTDGQAASQPLPYPPSASRPYDPQPVLAPSFSSRTSSAGYTTGAYGPLREPIIDPALLPKVVPRVGPSPQQRPTPSSSHVTPRETPASLRSPPSSSLNHSPQSRPQARNLDMNPSISPQARTSYPSPSQLSPEAAPRYDPFSSEPRRPRSDSHDKGLLPPLLTTSPRPIPNATVRKVKLFFREDAPEQ